MTKAPAALRQIRRTVVAERIGHQNLVRPCHAGDAVADVPGFVFCEDDGDEFHGGSK